MNSHYQFLISVEPTASQVCFSARTNYYKPTSKHMTQQILQSVMSLASSGHPPYCFDHWSSNWEVTIPQ